MIDDEMNPVYQQQVDIDAKLTRWKREFGQEAEFISKDSFPINCFDDIWTLNAEGANGTQLKVAFFHEKGWTDDVQCDVRRAMGSLANRLAATTMSHPNLTFLQVLNLTRFTQPEIEAEWPLLTDKKRVTLKVILKELTQLNPDKYTQAYDWLEKNHTPEKIKFNPYDIETGALNEFELQYFERELALLMKEKVSGLQENTDNYKVQLAKLTNIKPWISLRLMYALVRRPTNLRQLKWNDILPIGTSYDTNEAEMVEAGIKALDFSDEEELQVRIWKSKDKSCFRQSVEIYTRRLNAKLTAEIMQYRLAYRRCLEGRLSELKIAVTQQEIDTLLMRSPIIFNYTLFDTDFTSKRKLFTALSAEAAGFHDTSAIINAAISNVLPLLNLKSDRVVDIKVGNNRFRHTVATLASLMGGDEFHIADLLGNSLGSARKYIDLSGEHRANIDINFAGNNKLKQMFAANMVTLLKDERYAIGDSGQAKSIKPCGSCDEAKFPLACYGCDNFQVFEDGDHKSVLVDAQHLYDKRVANGDPSVVLGKLSVQIKWVEVSIEICNERIASRSALNAE